MAATTRTAARLEAGGDALRVEHVPTRQHCRMLFHMHHLPAQPTDLGRQMQAFGEPTSTRLSAGIVGSVDKLGGLWSSAAQALCTCSVDWSTCNMQVLRTLCDAA